MKLFIAGITLGLTLAYGISVLWPAAPAQPDTRNVGEKARVAESDVPRRMLEAPPSSPALQGNKDDARPFPQGSALLRIGESYVLGEDHARSSQTGADIVCLDIRARATLDFRNGVARSVIPLLTEGTLPSGVDCFGHAVDAPEQMGSATCELSPKAQADERYFGLVFVKDGNGQAYKVAVAQTTAEENALARTVTLRYERVATAAEGGRLHLPGSVQGTIVESAELERIAELVKAPGPMPKRGASVEGRIFATSTPSEDLEFHRQTRIEIDGDLRTSIKGPCLGVFVTGSVAVGATVESNSGVILIEGDLDGTLKVPGTGRVRIMGDLNGTLELEGASTAVIDGDVGGVLKIQGINHIYVKGRLLDPANNFDLSGINYTYLSSYLSKEDVVRCRKINGIQTLHLRESDIERADKPLTFRPWQNVHVGDPLWEQLR
ncbi:MAG: hypothetical protein GY946_28905 [bacterium]|nr:hypothetical protein [bacterium]